MAVTTYSTGSQAAQLPDVCGTSATSQRRILRPGRVRTYVRIMAKPVEKQEARRLRAIGWSLRQIALELDVSLSTASVWTGGISGPPAREPSTRPLETPDADCVALRSCGKCRRELPESSFNRRGDQRQWWCRECFRQYFRARGALHRRQSEEARNQRRKKAVQLVRNHLAEHPCVVCGEAAREVLDFDHVGPKRADVSALAYSGLSLPELRKEIGNCEVVCANCHRRRTAKRIGSWRLRPMTIPSSHSFMRTRGRNLAYIRDVLLESGCVDCGLSDILVLEFDHVGPKLDNVSNLVRDGHSLERIQSEIDCCEVRCANCHRRRTAQRRGQLRNHSP